MRRVTAITLRPCVQVITNGRRQQCRRLLRRTEAVPVIGGGEVVLDAAPERLQKVVDAVQFGLELEGEADAAAGLLSLEIDAGAVAPGAPGARGVGPVALDFARLAELAAGRRGAVSVGPKLKERYDKGEGGGRTMFFGTADWFSSSCCRRKRWRRRVPRARCRRRSTRPRRN